MAKFIVDGPAEAVMDCVRGFCSESRGNALESGLAAGAGSRFNVLTSDTTPTHHCAACFSPLGLRVGVRLKWRWTVSGLRDQCLAELQVRPPRSFLGLFILEALGVMCSAALVAGGVAAAYAARKDSVLSVGHAILGAMTGLPLLCLYLRNELRFSTYLRTSEAHFWDFLRRSYAMELVEPVLPVFFSRWADPVIKHGWITALVVAAGSKVAPVFGVLSLPGILCIVMVGGLVWLNLQELAKAWFSRDRFASYRIRSLRLLSLWWLRNVIIVAATAAFACMGVIAHSESEIHEANLTDTFAQIGRACSLRRVLAVCREFDSEAGRGGSNPAVLRRIRGFRERVRQDKTFASAGEDDATDASSARRIRPDLVPWSLLAAPTVLLWFLLSVIAWLPTVMLLLFLVALRDWSREEGHALTQRIALPSAAASGPLATGLRYVVVLGYFVPGFVANWAGTLLSLDVFAFLLTDRPVLLSALRYPFALARASPALCFVEMGKTPPAVCTVLGSVPLLMLATPGVLMLLRWATSILTTWLGHLKVLADARHAGPELTQQVRSCVMAAANKAGTATPSIRVIQGRAVWLRTWHPYFSARPVIEITDGALAILRDDEICAVLAHEIGHARRDLARVKLASFLSRISLFPNRMLALAIDFARLEFEADTFAVQILGSAVPLIRALVKTSISGSIERRAEDRASGLLARFFGQRPREVDQGGRRPLAVLEQLAGRTAEWLLKGTRGAVRNLILLDDFYFGPSLPGYAHPSLQSRMARLQLAHAGELALAPSSFGAGGRTAEDGRPDTQAEPETELR